MSTIGTFQKLEDGTLRGTVTTLTMSFDARFVPIEQPKPFDAKFAGPQYRVVGGPGSADIGAAWIKEARNANTGEYMFVTLDDPSFPTRLAANLFHQEDGTYSLVWTRDNGR